MRVIKGILNKVQISRAAHQKQSKILRMHYEKIPLEDFFEKISIVLKKIFGINTISQKNVYVERTLEFLAQFVADTTPEGINDDITDECTHPFLTMIIKFTLKHHNLLIEHVRYNSCLFIRLILQNIGSNKSLDNEVCDLIEDAMLERTLDPKSSVRLQAVLALIRLQDPMNGDSPITKAYLSLIVDANVQIRTEVVKNIAPCNASINQIVNRLRDIDPTVRMMAYRRCADLGPKFLKICERQHILTCGLNESDPKVKKTFVENLLPKWFNVYQNDYITFLNGLKLDADENDIENTEKLTKDILNLMFRSTSIEKITSILPFDENKVIPFDKLASETVVIWNILICYLRENENMEDYVDDILPNLTPFCHYIENYSIMKKKNKMEDWEFLDYQYILNNLFEIVEGYDFSDEVGRKTLHQLTIKFLREENLVEKLKKKIVDLASKTVQKSDDFTSIICHVISDIREPITDVEVESNYINDTDKECQKAELKVKIIRLESKLEEASDEQEYLKADALKKELDETKKKLKDLSTVSTTIETVKVTKDDPKTICDCLDILICMLSLPMVNSMTPSLVAIKEEFVVPLLGSTVSEINWRVIQCISMFCILEERLAEEFFKVICIPIITYRAIPNYNKQALMVAVKAVSDLFRLYGSKIFDSTELALSKYSNQSLNSTYNKRKLYHSEETDESMSLLNKFHFESIIEAILDMLDDEVHDIRNLAIEAISKLLLNNFPVSALFISRLILKWYNPLTAQSSDISQQLIGIVLTNFAKSSEAKELIAKSLLPTLHSISRAPRTSPLAAVDVDNLLLFISTVTDSEEKSDVSRTHENMAHIYLSEMLKKKNEVIAVYLSKLLLLLNIDPKSVVAIKELISQVETALENDQISDKTLKKNMTKFREKLNVLLEKNTEIQDSNLEVTDNTNSEENQGNSTNTNSIDNSASKHTSNTTNLSVVREEDEEDILKKSSVTTKVPEGQENINTDAITEVGSNENSSENAKKRNRNTESVDSSNNEEEQQSLKKMKLPIVLLSRNIIKQSKPKNKDEEKLEEQVSQHLSENKESDKSVASVEDNVLSATPEEDVNVSKGKKRKRSRTEETENVSPKVKVLQMVTIKPKVKNAVNGVKTRKKGANFDSGGSSISTRSSSSIRRTYSLENEEKTSKRKDSRHSCCAELVSSKDRHKNVNTLETKKIDKNERVEQSRIKNGLRSFKSDEKNDHINNLTSKHKTNPNTRKGNFEDTGNQENVESKRRNKNDKKTQNLSSSSKIPDNKSSYKMPPLTPKNTQNSIKNGKCSTSSESEVEVTNNRRSRTLRIIQQPKTIQQANSSLSTDSENSESRKSKRIQVLTKNIKGHNKNDELQKNQTSKDKQTSKIISSVDKNSPKNNKITKSFPLKPLHVPLASVGKGRNKTDSSDDTSPEKSQNRRQKNTSSKQEQNAGKVKNNQKILLTTHENDRKHKQLIVSLINSPPRAKRMRLRDEIIINNSRRKKEDTSMKTSPKRLNWSKTLSRSSISTRSSSTVSGDTSLIELLEKDSSWTSSSSSPVVKNKVSKVISASKNLGYKKRTARKLRNLKKNR